MYTNYSIFRPKPTKIDIGIFSLVSSTGTVAPGEVTAIEVTCIPNHLGPITEDAIFFISEAKPCDRKGVFIKMKVNGAMPSLDLTNFEDIFFEQYVVNSMKDFVCSEQVI